MMIVRVGTLDIAGGGDFFHRVRGFGEKFRPFTPRLRFFFFFLVEISSRTLIPVFGKDQSTVAQRAETTVTEFS